MLKDQKGFTHVLVLLLLLAGLGAGAYLVQQKTNFLPKASMTTPVSGPVTPTGPTGGAGFCPPEYYWDGTACKRPQPTSIGIPSPSSCTPCTADVTKDGGVNGRDTSYLVGCYNKTTADKDKQGRSCADRDINGDGKIDSKDVDCIKSQFLKKCEAGPTPTPSLTVVAPNGGETWTVGEIKRVSWTASNLRYVRIYIEDPTISGSGSTNYIYDGALLASQGYYDWTISQNQLPGGSSLPRNYRIRIDGLADATIGSSVIVKDYSNNTFKIVLPQAAAKRVFVTSTTYNGNLGGLTGADAKCQARANATSLGGTWKAWLSDSRTSASSRLTHATVPYKRVDGFTVASDWKDLTDGSLQESIRVTELKTKLGDQGSFFSKAWTNTKANGQIADAYSSCNNWTSGSASTGNGWAGTFLNRDTQWTESGSDPCSVINTNHLYCFEQ